jgi:hypothetical protein
MLGGSRVRNRRSIELGDKNWALASGGALVAVVLTSLLVLRSMFGQVEAILAFVGVLVTASVSVIGLMVSRQSNRRLAKEADQAERRLLQEHQDEKERLKLDAAMRAGALLTPSGAVPPNRAAAASGLLALTQLDHAELAVALLVDLWSDGKDNVSNETAVLVINTALRSNPTAQLVAAELLCRNAARLDSCQSLHWPSVVDGCWNPDFSPKTKLLLLDGLMGMTLAGKKNENALRSVAVRLYGVWNGDPDDRVRGCVGTLISGLIEKLKTLGYTDLLAGNTKVMLVELETAAASATENPDGFLDRIVADRKKQLAEWADQCDALDLAQGALGTAAHSPVPSEGADRPSSELQMAVHS